MSLKPKKMKGTDRTMTKGREKKAHKKRPSGMKTLSVEDIKAHWKRQGGRLRGYTLDSVNLYTSDRCFVIGVTGPKGKIQQDAYDKIEKMFSKSELESGGYIGVGSWSALRPNIYVYVPLDAELTNLGAKKQEASK